MIAGGWLGIFALCRSMGMGFVASLCAAWTYALNPYSQLLVTWVTGSAFAAVLPWLFWMLYKAATNERSRAAIAAIAATLTFCVLPWVASTPQLFFELLLVLAAWWLFLLRRSRDGFAGWTTTSLVLCTLAAGWWLIPEFFALFGNSIGHATQAGSVAWTFANSSLLNNLRFVNVWTWSYPTYIPYASAYDANLLTYSSGFFGVIVLAVALLSKRIASSPTFRFFGLLALAAMFIAKGLHPPLQQINGLIYKIPPFFLLIEGGGLTIAALLALSVIVAQVVQHISERDRGTSWRSRLPTIAMVAATAGAALFSASPMLNGLVFSAHSENRHYVALPQYWRNAATYLNAERNPGAVLVLPADNSYQASYDWGYVGVDLIPASLFFRPSLLLGPSLDYLVDPRLESVKARIRELLAARSDALVPALESLGIRYILCRDDLAQQSASIHDYKLNFLGKRADARQFGKLTLYSLPKVSQRFSIYTKFFTGNYNPETQAGDFLELRARLGDLPRIAQSVPGAHAASFENVVRCALTCKHNAIPHDVFVLGHKSVQMALPGATNVTVAFDNKPKRQPLESLNLLAPNIAGISKMHSFVTTFETIAVSKNDSIVYLFNPAEEPVVTTMFVKSRLRKGASHPCISAAAESAYLLPPSNPAFTMRACLRHGSPALRLSHFVVAPGLSRLLLRGPFEQPSPAGVTFASSQPVTARIRAVPQGTVFLSARRPHAVISSLLAAVPLRDDPVLETTALSPASDVNLSRVLVLRYAGSLYACYVPGLSVLNVTVAARNCFASNNVPVQLAKVMLQRSYIDYSLAAGSFYSANRSAVLAESRLTAHGPPLGATASTSTNNWSPGVQIEAGSVIDIEMRGDNIASANMSITSECNGVTERVTYRSTAPIPGRYLEERLPVPRAMSCNKEQLLNVLVATSLRQGETKRPHILMRLLQPMHALTIGLGPQLAQIPFVSGHAASRLVAPGIHIALERQPIRTSLVALSRPEDNHDSRHVVSAFQLLGLLTIITAPPGVNAGLLTDEQSFSRTWIAITGKPHIALLPHVTVDGWLNGWEIAGHGTILVFNVVSLLEVLMAIVGLGLIPYLWMRVLWKR